MVSCGRHSIPMHCIAMGMSHFIEYCSTQTNRYEKVKKSRHILCLCMYIHHAYTYVWLKYISNVGILWRNWVSGIDIVGASTLFKDVRFPFVREKGYSYAGILCPLPIAGSTLNADYSQLLLCQVPIKGILSWLVTPTITTQYVIEKIIEIYYHIIVEWRGNAFFMVQKPFFSEGLDRLFARTNLDVKTSI